jgi:SSS family solute:Na+ symporter
MNPLAGGLVVAGLVAAVFSTASAVALAGAALLMKDFYIPFINKNATDAEALRFSRISTIMMGLLPIPFAIYVPQILNTLFFARGLRTSISAVVVLMFYAPHFSSGRGATIGMLIAAIVTTVWYLANNPFKIDSIYIAAATPLIIMGLDHLYRQYFRGRPVNSD